jgi:hypothetical protein
MKHSHDLIGRVQASADRAKAIGQDILAEKRDALASRIYINPTFYGYKARAAFRFRIIGSAIEKQMEME